MLIEQFLLPTYLLPMIFWINFLLQVNPWDLPKWWGRVGNWVRIRLAQGFNSLNCNRKNNNNPIASVDIEISVKVHTAGYGLVGWVFIIFYFIIFFVMLPGGEGGSSHYCSRTHWLSHDITRQGMLSQCFSWYFLCSFLTSVKELAISSSVCILYNLWFY